MNRKDALHILKIKVKYKELNEQLLKKSYRNECLKTHPDKNKNKCEEDFLKVKEAYDFLKEDLLNKKNTEIDELENYEEYNEIYDLLLKYTTWLKPLYEYFFMDTILLNPSIHNLLKKDMYFLKEFNTYIPLWHRQIILHNKINIIIQPNLPENITIDDDNNIYIKINNETENYTISGISFFIPLNENKKYFKGIPKINEKNIYDITEYSKLIFIRS